MWEYHELRDKEAEGWGRRSPADGLASTDVARLTAMIAKLVPYSARQMLEYIHVAPGKSDLAVAALCSAYRDGTDMERAFIRSRINEEQAWNLLTFSKRAAVHGLQTGQAEHVRLSLLAHAIENLAAGDVRDNLVALGLVYHCAEAIHSDTTSLFEEAAQMAGPAIAAVLRDFIRRADLGGIVGKMGFEEAKSQGQTGFRWAEGIGKMAPPWIIFEGSARSDASWQCGKPAEYLAKWMAWYRTLPAGARTAYTTAFEEPKGWSGFYESVSEEKRVKCAPKIRPRGLLNICGKWCL